MKKFLILLSVILIGSMAFYDAKDRLQELDEMAATTPSQEHMQRVLPPPTSVEKVPHSSTIVPPMQTEEKKLHEQIQDNSSQLKDKFNRIEKRRKNNVWSK